MATKRRKVKLGGRVIWYRSREHGLFWIWRANTRPAEGYWGYRAHRPALAVPQVVHWQFMPDYLQRCRKVGPATVKIAAWKSETVALLLLKMHAYVRELRGSRELETTLDEVGS